MKRSWSGLLIYYMKCSPFIQEQAPTRELGMEVESGGEQDLMAAAAAVAEKKRNPGGWKCMPYIIGNETFEKVATTGLMANFTVYLVKHYNMEQVRAVNLTNILGGTTNFAPLVGAFISDAYAGRFLTLAYSSVASFVGMVVLTLTAAVPQLRPPRCSEDAKQSGHCIHASLSQIGVLFLSLALLTIGAAGIRPCSLPFGVDQFDKLTADGRRGLNRFFNWYYCTSTGAAMVSLTFIVYIQDSISWPIGFAIPTALMALSILLFFVGARSYVHVPPQGSVFSGIARVFVAAFRNRRLPLPDDTAALHNPDTAAMAKLPPTHQFSWLNKAAVKADSSSKWRLCTVQQVEEVKCLLRIVPIWASGMVCFVALAQQWTFAILQSLTMDRRLGPGGFEVPPGSMGVIALLALTLFIPVYDLAFVPLARRVTGLESGITLLQRQGIGMAVAAGSMVVAAAVERRRRESAVAHGGTTPMSAMWLAPQLAVMGVAEAFNAVGQIEFYNRQFPEHMLTLAGSLFFCSLAGANYMSSVVVTVVKERTWWLNDDINLGRVDYFYYVIAMMGVVNLMYFVVVAHFYRYKGTPEVVKEMN